MVLLHNSWHCHAVLLVLASGLFPTGQKQVWDMTFCRDPCLALRDIGEEEIFLYTFLGSACPRIKLIGNRYNRRKLNKSLITHGWSFKFHCNRRQKRYGGGGLGL